MNPNDWFFGLDAGATRTRLYARSIEGSEDFELFGTAANALRHGIDQTASVLSCLINEAIQRLAPANLRAIHAGIAGASAPSIQDDLVHRIRTQVDTKNPFHIGISHDGIIALEGAFSGENGLLFIAGTGSGVLVRTGPDLTDVDHVGGWGYLIGDEGSGHAIGRRGLTAVGHALDGGPRTLLTERVNAHLKISDRQSLLRTISQKKWDFQHVAPLVLRAAEEKDSVATSIVREEAESLAQQAGWLLKRHPELNPRFTIIGGLSNSEFYVDAMCRIMKSAWPQASFSLPAAAPAEGAAQIAIRQATRSDVR